MGKPSKPYPTFPLTPHATGQWCKKIRGRQYYFGTDWQEALVKYENLLDEPEQQVDDSGPIRLGDLLNLFLAWKRDQRDQRRRTKHVYDNYVRLCRQVLEAVDRNRVVDHLKPEDFREIRKHIGKGIAPTTLSLRMAQLRHIFSWAYKTERHVERPVHVGDGLDRPEAIILRKHKASQQNEILEASELLGFVHNANPQTRAIILLAVNCGFNPVDIAELLHDHIQGEWVRGYPRKKTAVNRKCWLWPETLEAVNEVIAEKPPYVFRRHEAPLSRYKVYHSFKAISGDRATFKDLRTLHRTIADEAGDQRAADCIMGHLPPHISNDYVRRVSDERVKKVSGHVRAWLFGGADK